MVSKKETVYKIVEKLQKIENDCFKGRINILRSYPNYHIIIKKKSQNKIYNVGNGLA